MEDSLRYRVYQAAIRDCLKREVVADLSSPANVRLWSVLTTKKHRLIWQKRKLEEKGVRLADMLDSSSKAERSLNSLTDVPEVPIYSFNRQYVVDDKGNLKASAEKYAHINLEAEDKYTAQVDLGKVTYKQMDAQAVANELSKLKIQRNHWVMKERKPTYLYIVIRVDYAEKLIMTTSIKKSKEASIGASAKPYAEGEGDLSFDESSDTHLQRPEKSIIGYNCAKVKINPDNSLQLCRYDAGQEGLNRDEVDGAESACIDSPDGGGARFRKMLQPFDLIRSQADVQRVLLAWVTSCPTDDTIYFLEELLDNILTSGDSAKTCQLPASWICKSFTPECLTAPTISMLELAGIKVIQLPHQEAELQWNCLSNEQIDLLSAFLSIVALTDDLTADQQSSIGDVGPSDANDFVEVFVAAADVKIPRMDKEDEHRSNWARLKHPALERLANPPASGTLQSLGLHVGVDDKASALFDSFLLDSSCLSNLAALVHTLCLPSAD